MDDFNSFSINRNPNGRSELNRNVANLPGELLNSLADDLLAFEWPASHASSYNWTPAPLRFDLIYSRDSNIRSAVRYSLSKKIFVYLHVTKCNNRPGAVDPPLFLLPRILSDQDFAKLTKLGAGVPEHLEMYINIGCEDASNLEDGNAISGQCDCDQVSTIATTVFILDELTALLLISTMHRDPMRFWRSIDVQCRIHSETAAKATERVLDFMVRTVPAKRVQHVNIGGHPHIIDIGSFLSGVLEDPTDEGKLVATELKLDQVEKVAEDGLFVHQVWPNTIQDILRKSYENCVSCMLYDYEVEWVQGSLPSETDIIFRLRIRICKLYFKGLLNSLATQGHIRFPVARFLMKRKPLPLYCIDGGNEFWNPYKDVTTDFAMAVWIVSDFLAQIQRIPPEQVTLLHLIFSAVQDRALLMTTLAQDCCSHSPNGGRTLRAEQIWPDSRQGTLDPNAIMTHQDFYNLAKCDIEWCTSNWQYSDLSEQKRKEWEATLNERLSAVALIAGIQE